LIGNRSGGKFYVDVSGVIDYKKKAILAHKSQFDKKKAERIISQENIHTQDNSQKAEYYERFDFIELCW
jgi:LmbE family N-acetylglucosaminyl deacetylase